jgi:metal-responsive CopG/Arc/MetJ family transcriptional regulator
MYGARLSDELVQQIDAWAEANDVSRSEAIRRLVEIGLKSKGKEGKR